jgi:hypothetical protein
MGLFRPKKADDTFAEEKESGHGALDFSQIEKDKEFVAGMSDPDAGVGRAPRGDLSRTLLIGIPLIVVLFGVLVYFGWDLVSEFTGGGTAIEKTAKNRVGITDEEYMELLARIRERDEKLQTLERERDQIFVDVERRIQNALKDAGVLEDTKQRLEESTRRLAEMSDNQALLADSINQLREELSKRPAEEQKPLYPESPRQGSSGQSILYNTLAQRNERIATIERELEERAAVPPPFSISRGVHPGTYLKGILNTALISSPALENFKAVVELTEPFEVLPGSFIPKGTLFLGKAKSDLAETRRMYMEITEMRVGNITVPIKGMVLQNGNPGMVSKYVDPLNSAAWSMLLPNLLAAAADAAQDMIETKNSITGSTEERPEFSTRNVLLQGAGDSMRLQSQIMYEVQARKKPVIIVRRGIPVEIQITDTIPLEVLLDSGIISSER